MAVCYQPGLILKWSTTVKWEARVKNLESIRRFLTLGLPEPTAAIPPLLVGYQTAPSQGRHCAYDILACLLVFYRRLRTFHPSRIVHHAHEGINIGLDFAVSAFLLAHHHSPVLIDTRIICYRKPMEPGYRQ